MSSAAPRPPQPTVLVRRAFSSLHLQLANESGAITPAHEQDRPRIKTYPIDAAQPHIIADRDDGIFVETRARDTGGYRLYITIADVAGHVSLDSLLAQTALARGFTLYGAGWTDPMFPKALEEKMSLEHRQDRLGFTVRIDLDSLFKPVLTTFLPSITHAESLSYAQASERMSTDPQLQQMAIIAHGIRQSYFAAAQNERLLLDIRAERPPPARTDQKTHNAMTMVATYMLLANRCVAEFFDHTRLPYLYRNFDSEQASARASYSPRNIGHDALHRDAGALGAYGHFTSPIRRAADLLNHYMAHFAFEVMAGVEKKTIPHGLGKTAGDFHDALWQHAPTLLRLCTPSVNAEIRALDLQEAEKILTLHLMQSQEAAQDILAYLQSRRPPLSLDDMERHAQKLDALTHAPATRAFNKSTKDYKTIENLDKYSLAKKGKKAFSALLHCAAGSGQIPRLLFDETLARIAAGSYDKTQDGFSILVLAAHPLVPRWDALKRSVLRDIKHDPSTVSNIIQKSRRFFNAGALDECSAHLPSPFTEQGGFGSPKDVFASILTLRQDHIVSAPFYSVGHDRRAAASHARYAFLEHYAFGELQPIKQPAFPNLLYAEMESSQQSRYDLVQQMVTQAGGSLHIIRPYSDLHAIHQIIVSGGKFNAPVFVEAIAETPQAAEQSALRRLLRDIQFKHAVAPALQVESLINPQDVLQQAARTQGMFLSIRPAVQQPKGDFLTEIYLTSQDLTVNKYKGKGSNKARSLRAAASKALKAMGTPVISGQAVASWVAEVQRPTRYPAKESTKTCRSPEMAG